MPEDNELEFYEKEVASHKSSIAQKYAEHLRYCEMANTGSLCRCCGFRPMATDNDLGYGAGVCATCMEEALELLAVR